MAAGKMKYQWENRQVFENLKRVAGFTERQKSQNFWEHFNFQRSSNSLFWEMYFYSIFLVRVKLFQPQNLLMLFSREIRAY